ncbi:hypothetical protein P4S64_19510 [Vibrio sp. M60_M31a]
MLEISAVCAIANDQNKKIEVDNFVVLDKLAADTAKTILLSNERRLISFRQVCSTFEN